MTRLAWDQVGERTFETGIDRGVLYPMSGPGVPWNGLVSVTENSSGGDSQPYHYDGVKYYDEISGEDFQATIEAFSHPDEFGPCDGNVSLFPGLILTRQPRQSFGLAYRTLTGTDVDAESGYKLHLIYNAKASPTARLNRSIQNVAAPVNFQWTVNAVPDFSGCHKPTAHIVIDSREHPPSGMAGLEEILYGNAENEPRLPTQGELFTFLAESGSFTLPDCYLPPGEWVEIPITELVIGTSNESGTGTPSAIIDVDGYLVKNPAYGFAPHFWHPSFLVVNDPNFEVTYRATFVGPYTDIWVFSMSDDTHPASWNSNWYTYYTDGLSGNHDQTPGGIREFTFGANVETGVSGWPEPGWHFDNAVSAGELNYQMQIGTLSKLVKLERWVG